MKMPAVHRPDRQPGKDAQPIHVGLDSTTALSWRLSRRAGLPLIALVVLCVGVWVIRDLQVSGQETRSRYADTTRGLELISDLQFQVQEARRTWLYALATPDSNRQVEYADLSRAAEREALHLMRETARAARQPGESARVDKLETDWRSYLTVRDELIALVLEGNNPEAVEKDLSEGAPAFNRVRDGLQAVQLQFKNEAGRLLQEMDSAFHHSILRTAIILALVLVCAFVAIRMIQKSDVLKLVRASEMQLRESQQRFELAVVGSSDGLWDWDLKTGKIFFSPRWKEILGYPNDELENDQWIIELLLHVDDREPTASALENYLAGHTPNYEVEYRMQCCDGSFKWILCRGAALRDEAGRPVRMAGSHTDISARKASEAEMARLHKELVDFSRRAGMAEVATGVLHNVGNVLNSANVSATLVADRMKKSRIKDLATAVAMMREQNGHLAEFLTSHPKGKVIPKYLDSVTEHLVAEQQMMVAEVESLGRHIIHIKEIVAMQQNYATVSGAFENLHATELVGDALHLNASAFARHGISVVQDIAPHTAQVCVDRHKVLQILINLFRNAKHAMEQNGGTRKRLAIQISPAGPEFTKIVVTDNGIGIPSGNLTRIFQHGFTTRKDGHGFGLHSGANAAKEMGGGLSAHSEGTGKGATFTLELPVARAAAVAA